MENITMTNTTQITRVRFACPQIADRSLTVGTDSTFGTPTFYAPMHKAPAVKDVAFLRSWSPPV